MRRALFALAVLLAVTPSPARAQPSRAVANVAAITAQIRTRASTLTQAGDLPLEVVQRLAVELEHRIDLFVDASAPFPSLASAVPDLRESISKLENAAGQGDPTTVEIAAGEIVSESDSLMTAIRTLGVPLPPY